MSQKVSARVTDVITLFVVTAASLLLLVYVGFAEGRRTVEQLHVEKLTTHGRILQSALENYLRAGLPLNQYAGFAQVADPVVHTEEIDAIAAYDSSGRLLFSHADDAQKKLPDMPLRVQDGRSEVSVQTSDAYYSVVLPLRTRFESVGSIVLHAPTSFVKDQVNSSFRVLVYGALGLSAAFAIFVFLSAPYLTSVRAPWLQIGYAVTFLTMAALVIGTLVNLYSDGIQGKVRSSALTLSQRLSDIAEFNLRFRDFHGVDKALAEYLRLNPEIKAAALITNGLVEISTDGSMIGKPWYVDQASYEYKISLSDSKERKKFLAVAAPKNTVYQRVESSVRDFAVLFVASGFMAGLFLQVASSMQRLRSGGESARTESNLALSNETALIIVKPIFFLSVFLENLTYSFLPKFMQEAAAASGMSIAFASAPFTIYYVCFALILIPAGHFAERRGPKLLICIGLALASVSLFALILPVDIVALTLLRALAGIGQGMLFIGIQAYILAVSPPEKKTQGAAIIVFGFQGGMIAGMAIGSLLVVYVQPKGVFALSGIIGFFTVLYSVLLIPNGIRRVFGGSQMMSSGAQVFRDLATVMQNLEFLRTILCIGVPAKAMLTGTIMFALPLLLGQHGYRQEEIGQIIMLYGVGVVAASTYASRLVDRTGKTDLILFLGALVSGFGLVLVGLMDASKFATGLTGTLTIVAGVVVVGLAHGFINAPVVTHIAHSQLAAQIGPNPATTAYRFLERVGHAAGPLLIGQAFLIWGQSANVLIWIGVATTVLSFLFLALSAPKAEMVQTEAAR